METEEVVEEAANVVEVVYKTAPAVVVGVFLIGAGVGVTAALYISRKRLKTQYEQLAEKEIEEAKRFYEQKARVTKNASPDVLAEKYHMTPEPSGDEDIEIEEDDDEDVFPESTASHLIEDAEKIANEKAYVSYDKVEAEARKEGVEEQIKKNLFEYHETVRNDDFDLDDELDKKKAGKPYIIEAEEFYENETDYSQTSLMYYEGDDVLADERDQPIRNYMQIIGHDNLHFGRGSKDRNIVFIRNEKLEAEYEIARNHNKYSEEVMGFIEHAEKRPLRKFRETD